MRPAHGKWARNAPNTHAARPAKRQSGHVTTPNHGQRSFVQTFPRYGVTFEYPSTPQARAFGVASVAIQAIDTKTGEVLGTYVQHVKGAGFSSTESAWLSADKCPFRIGDMHGLIRQFVDTVLVPIKE